MDFLNRNKLWDMLWSCFGITLCIRKGILVFAVLPSDSKVNGTKSKFQLWLIFSLCCRRTSNTTRCLNLGSYNYLGFAAADEYCTPRVIESLKKYSASTCSVRVDGGTPRLSTCFYFYNFLGNQISNQIPFIWQQARPSFTPNWRSWSHVLLESLLLSYLAWVMLQTLPSFLA